jgi:histidinol-phosphate/aromatic aminotransferase/cobyric acid decarboxylase-like protein
MFGDGVNPLTKYKKPPVQCYHGGQSHRLCPNFKCDFSVTTNVSGPPAKAIEAAKQVFTDIEHYPDQDAWVPRCHVADVLGINPFMIRIGNGASEFIDILSRIWEPGTTWRPYPSTILYREFRRAFENAGLIKKPSDDATAEITVICNPNSVTGDFYEINELREIIKRDEKSTFIIDESFIMCYGPDWKEQSAIKLIPEFGDRVIVVTSWTKVFACPLLRLGTVISTEHNIERIAKIQPPWTVNGLAQAFFISAVHDKDYFKEMWEITPKWHKEMVDLINEFGAEAYEKAPNWVPFIYVDFKTKEAAERADRLAFDNGLPIRLCADYGKPSHVRLGVRDIKYVKMLIDIWKADEELTKLMAK